MLIEKKKNKEFAPTSFRVEKEIVKEFRELCKKHNVSQVAVVRNAMKQVIQELKAIDS